MIDPKIRALYYSFLLNGTTDWNDDEAWHVFYTMSPHTTNEEWIKETIESLKNGRED